MQRQRGRSINPKYRDREVGGSNPRYRDREVGVAILDTEAERLE